MANALPRGYISGRRVVVVVAALMASTLGLSVMSAFRNRDTFDRRHEAEVAFEDPTRTTQSWTVSDRGAVHTAVASRPSRPEDAARDDQAQDDQAQDDQARDDQARDETVELIRLHMHQLLIQRRNAGNFGTPAFEGIPMPGRDELEELIPEISFVESEVPEGARLEYRTSDPAAIEALKQWVQAQREGPKTPRPRSAQ